MGQISNNSISSLQRGQLLLRIPSENLKNLILKQKNILTLIQILKTKKYRENTKKIKKCLKSFSIKPKEFIIVRESLIFL